MNIAKIDENFAVKTSIQKDGLSFFDVRNEPFRVHGIFFDGEGFRRLPIRVAQQMSERIQILCQHTAGGRVRFVTDSPYVAVHAKLHHVSRFPHFSLTGSAGIDLYAYSRGKSKPSRVDAYAPQVLS